MRQMGYGLMLVVLLPIELAATTAPTDPPKTATVTIDNFSFKPSELVIARGTTVTWVNRDDVPHTATAKGKAPAFDSKTIDGDERFAFKFDAAGTYKYYCKVHPHMTGTIVVK